MTDQATEEETQSDERTDSTGRVLYPWEVSAEDQVFAVDPEGDDEDEGQGTEQTEAEQTEQPAEDPPGTGDAPA